MCINIQRQPSGQAQLVERIDVAQIAIGGMTEATTSLTRAGYEF
jgi:hypothetical protein